MPPKPLSKKSQKIADLKHQPTTSESDSDMDNDGDETSTSDEYETAPSQSSSVVSTQKQDRNLAPAITLSCLRDWDSRKMDQCFQNYVSQLKSKGRQNHLKMGVLKISKVEDFTPWWDEFSRPGRKSGPKLTKSAKNTGPDSFDNWFDKSCDGGSSSNWLCGPGPSKTSETSSCQESAPVEDIEVPSIYDQTPQTKGRRQLKKERKAEREKTLGKKWFEMRAPEVDDATRMDMEMIRMRGVLDPKRFYKHNDRRAMPKYFQMGTVVDEGTDFYSSRLTKKQRKQTLVEELMADANVRQYNKRKYSEVQQKMRTKKKFKGGKAAAS